MFVKGHLYRQINKSFRDEWEALKSSGLLDDLVKKGLLIPYEDADLSLALTQDAIAVIKPEQIPLISYPYEWSFSQLKQAALLTLKIMQESLAKGFWLRDASAYNIQVYQGKPVLIDTLSLGPYEADKPWPAYGQFCRHFVAPLILMASCGLSLQRLLSVYLDGIPLDVASRLLPWKSRLKAGVLAHIHLHAAATKNVKAGTPTTQTHMSKAGLLGMLSSLVRLIEGLQPPKSQTVWGDYYQQTNYDAPSFEAKKALVRELVDLAAPHTSMIWDLGGNTGVFSEAVASPGRTVVCWDGDPLAVEHAFVKWQAHKETQLIALIQDFSNPSPRLGWAHQERDSLEDRGPADLTLALALIHHLAIGNNVPLPDVAHWLASLGKFCLVEFVPKSDSQVQKMLASRKDIFDTYHLEGFLSAFQSEFELITSRPIEGTDRTLHLFEVRGG